MSKYDHLKTPDDVKNHDIWSVVYTIESPPIIEIGSKSISAVLRGTFEEFNGGSCSSGDGLRIFILERGQALAMDDPGPCAVGKVLGFAFGVAVHAERLKRGDPSLISTSIWQDAR